jgi:hypothetical protein
VLGLAAGLPLLAAGCVSVPTTGPVSPVTPSGSFVARGGDIDVRPPDVDATPLAIVQGFLLAMASGATDLSQARLFLVPDKQEGWQPSRVLIYSNTAVPKATGTSVVLETGTLVGQLDDKGAFRRVVTGTTHDFGMRKDADGQWRIGNPPPALLLSRSFFQTFYSSYNLYFFEPTYRRLVPDPIFLPYSRGSSQLAAALVQSLIEGPTDFLRASVRNAIPAGTQLEAQSVVVQGGIADIQLSDPVLTLNEQQRTLMAAQLSWTLDQVSDLRGLQINNGTLPIDGTVNTGPDAYLPVEVSEPFGPVPNLDPDLFGLLGKAAVAVDVLDERAETRPVPGPLGAGDYDLVSFAVSATGERAAAVTATDELHVGPLSGPLDKVLSGVGRLLRPQMVLDEAWTISQRGGVATVRVVRGKKAVQVDAPWLEGDEIVAFRVAADGTRIAVVRSVDAGSELGLMAILRADDTITLGPLRPIDVVAVDNYNFDAKVLIDVAWQNSTTLMVLGGPGPRATMEPYTVGQNGYQIEKAGLSNNWGAKQLTAAPATATKAVILGSQNRTFRFASQSSWDLFSTDLRFVTFEG